MLKKADKNFTIISLMCVFLLVMMISFSSVNIKGTFSANEVSCYACSDSGKYFWGDYSSDSSCDKMNAFNTKENCLFNNCAAGENLDDNGNCVSEDGVVTVVFKVGSLTVHRNTCTLSNGSCRISLPDYQGNLGWSEQPNCTSVVENSKLYLTFTKAKTYTYYSCNKLNEAEGENSNTDTPSSPSSSQQSNPSSSNTDKVEKPVEDDNPETGSASIILFFLGAFLMFLYAGYVYRNNLNNE